MKLTYEYKVNSVGYSKQSSLYTEFTVGVGPDMWCVLGRDKSSLEMGSCWIYWEIVSMISKDVGVRQCHMIGSVVSLHKHVGTNEIDYETGAYLGE